MEVKVCHGCKKLFQHISGPILCPRCKQLEEEMFLKVKDYLRDNPGSNMYEVNQATGVSAALIEKFLKQGRLQVTEDSPIALTCERCGKRVPTGRYCKDCKNELSNELNEVKKNFLSSETQSTSGAKMRFLKSDKVHY